MKVVITDDRIKPDMIKYKTSGSAGIDLYALPNESKSGSENMCIFGYNTVFHTGIKVEIPEGYVGLIFPRSSVGFKGLRLANSTGVIDSDYRGEILIGINSWSPKNTEIKEPVRVAQLCVIPCPQVEIEIVEELSETERGENGFGSTGEE